MGQEKTKSAVAEELDRCFRPALLAYFTRRLKDSAEAEDLTQEVFVRLVNHPDRHNGQSLQAYVFVIAGNLLRDRIKSAGARYQNQSQSLEQLREIYGEGPELSEVRNPERVLVGKETLKDVLSVLSELGERTRDIFILARLENMNHREIALLHGISVSAVEKHVMKASAHLGARIFAR
jgi:RNA polymerase sigma-70 factor (ECF subfamily)